MVLCEPFPKVYLFIYVGFSFYYASLLEVTFPFCIKKEAKNGSLLVRTNGLLWQSSGFDDDDISGEMVRDGGIASACSSKKMYIKLPRLWVRDHDHEVIHKESHKTFVFFFFLFFYGTCFVLVVQNYNNHWRVGTSVIGAWVIAGHDVDSSSRW